MYNPLNLFTPLFLERAIEEGNRYFVRQSYYRAKDHVIDDHLKAAFIFSHYKTKEEAEKHYQTIAKDKYRKIYDAENPEDLENLRAGAQPEGYKIYTSLFAFEKWKPPDHLLKKIRRYVYQNFEAKNGEIKVLPYVEYGEINVRFKQGKKEIAELLSTIEECKIMCYHISFDETVESIYAYIPELKEGVKLNADFQAMYLEPGFIFPKHPVILREDGTLKLKMFEWGMIAGYMKGTTVNGADRKQLDLQRMKLLNARAERIVQDTKSIWYRKRNKRCLIPVTGFFEFREAKGFKTKIPYFIRLKERRMFFLPGLYNYAHIPNTDGELIGTFTLIIRAANSVMVQIHNSGDNPFRMPLMLTEDLERKWISEELTDNDIQTILNFEMPSGKLEYWPVKSLYRADPYDPELIATKEYAGLEPVTI